MARSASTRLTAQQICPLPLVNRPEMRSEATVSASASAQTMVASLPPSSRCTFFSVSAASLRICRPAAVLPVIVTICTPLARTSAAPTTSPEPVTT